MTDHHRPRHDGALDPLAGVGTGTDEQREAEYSGQAALVGANRLALLGAILFSALAVTFTVMGLGADVNAVERTALIMGSLSGGTGFWAIYGLTRHALTVRDRTGSPRH